MTKKTIEQAYEELRQIIDGGSESFTHADAVQYLKDRLEQSEREPLEYWNAVEGWVKIDEVREHLDSVGCATIYKTAGEGRVPLSLCKAQPEQEPVNIGRELKMDFAAENDKRLAQPEQRSNEHLEPVAWMHPSGGVVQRLITGFDRELYTIPLYTTPPQRKPLTNEQADSIINGLRTCLHLDSKRVFLKTWLRDWAAHGIKE